MSHQPCGRASRGLHGIVAAGLMALMTAVLAACSHHAAPPAGRWEGVYDQGNAIVAARLEITPKGDIFISAPNAEDIGDVSPEDRAAIRSRLADGLAQGWSDVKPLDWEFDGKTFRKPGGIAPQAVWDNGQMMLVVYLGRGAINVPMRAVKDFSPDPFAPA